MHRCSNRAVDAVLSSKFTKEHCPCTLRPFTGSTVNRTGRKVGACRSVIEVCSYAATFWSSATTATPSHWNGGKRSSASSSTRAPSPVTRYSFIARIWTMHVEVILRRQQQQLRFRLNFNFKDSTHGVGHSIDALPGQVTWLQLKSLLTPVDDSTGVPLRFAIIANFRTTTLLLLFFKSFKPFKTKKLVTRHVNIWRDSI